MSKIEVRGRTLGYSVAGDGPPFVFLGSTAQNKEYFHEYQVPFFSKHFTVVTLDQRCVGESDRINEAFETRDLAEDALAILDALGLTEPAHVLGHSMGGRTAQWMALDHPNRVRTLVLVSSGSGQYDPNQPVERCPPIWQLVRMIEIGFDAYIEDIQRGRLAFTDDFRAAHPEILDRLAANWQASNPEPLGFLLHTAARQRHETTDRLGDIACPALVLHGSEDTVMGGTSFHPASSRVLADRIPNARLEQLPGAAHHVFWQIPDLVNARILEFLLAN
jgi:pimeloyl-ACP methyl ester carboxylesterase